MADRDPIERFAAYAVMLVGGLMLGLSGLCTAGVGWAQIAYLFQPGQSGGLDSLGGLVTTVIALAIFGGIPMVAGFLILRWGRRLNASGAPTGGQHEPLAGAIGLALGGVLAVVGAAASLWLLAVAIQTLARGGRDSFYGLMVAPFVFMTGLLTAFGLWLAISAYRMWRPRPPPSSAPPPG
ncbi:hypothetical protein [Phenylobacterium sp.]|uniref:hypothetical protein n=1 Tax=Phenylobacterium sp. TaxID=1871053 RepID=UPI002C102AA6|nr:hypothetical protein [Phenylobacterium sp.]HLZ73711.1 hypothetical protein [Phenylobacterium sp.]